MMNHSKRILLVYPPSPPILREDRCQVPADIVISPSLPPTDLMYLAAVAEEGGRECRIADYSLGGRTVDDFVADLREFQPDYLVISATTPTLETDLALCSIAKSMLPDIRTIAKGAHFLRFDREALERHPDLDMVIRGEAEMTFRDIIRREKPDGITGLTWRSNGNSIIENPNRPFLDDLDALPFPARHLIDNGRYRRPDTGAVQGVIKVSRGCPYHCFFCLATPVSGSRLRKRSPDNIVEEARTCVERYGIRDFIFWSDIFTLDRDWVMDLCGTILRSGLTFTWSANARADTIDREMAEMMRKAGCRLVSVGVESGNQEMLDKMGKRQSIDRIRHAFTVFREVGLKTLAYFLIGLPWETRKTAEDTVRFAVELDSDFASFFIAAPLPGTAFFDYAEQNGMIKSGGNGCAGLCAYAYSRPVVDGLFLGRDELFRLRREAIRLFHLRPHYIMKRLRGIRSAREALGYSRAAWSIVRS